MYATPSQARAYYAGEDTSGVTLDVPMRQAARLVQRYAPVPDPLPADYSEMAADAELMVGAYLFETGGYITGDSLTGVGSSSYSSTALRDIAGIVRGAMGDYAGSGAYTLEVASTFPETAEGA